MFHGVPFRNALADGFTTESGVARAVHLRCSMLDSQQTVAAVVLDHSECAEVFQQHRIDFCCKGDLSLEAAAQGRGVEVKALLTELEGAIEKRQGVRSADPRNSPRPRWSPTSWRSTTSTFAARCPS